MVSDKKIGHDAVSLAGDFGPFEPIEWLESDNEEEQQSGDPFGLDFTDLSERPEDQMGVVGLGLSPDDPLILMSDSEGEMDDKKQQQIWDPVQHDLAPGNTEEQLIGDLFECNLAPSTGDGKGHGWVDAPDCGRTGEYPVPIMMPTKIARDPVGRGLASCSADEQQVFGCNLPLCSGDGPGPGGVDAPNYRPTGKGLAARTMPTKIAGKSRFKPAPVRLTPHVLPLRVRLADSMVPYTELLRPDPPPLSHERTVHSDQEPGSNVATKDFRK
jgi:hypothetical protein